MILELQLHLSSAKANTLTSSIVKLFAILFETLLFFILGSQFDPSTLPDVWDFDLAVLFLITIARFDKQDSDNWTKLSHPGCL